MLTCPVQRKAMPTPLRARQALSSEERGAVGFLYSCGTSVTLSCQENRESGHPAI